MFWRKLFKPVGIIVKIFPLSGDVLRERLFCHSELVSESHSYFEEKKLRRYEGRLFTLTSQSSNPPTLLSSNNHSGGNASLIPPYALKKRAAFTLAEVLITLGIIGVVAALTMPALIANYQDKVAVTRLKKVYSILSQAYQKAYYEYGEPTNWGLTDIGTSGSDKDYQSSLTLFNVLGKGLTLSKTCGQNPGCFYDGYYKFSNGNSWQSFDTVRNRHKVITSDGVSLAFHGYSATCNANINNLSDACGLIYVDLDGPFRGKHTFGQDFFQFAVTKYGILPRGTQTYEPELFRDCLTKGDHCTAWVLVNENRDYLYCDDLSWSGKRTCK